MNAYLVRQYFPRYTMGRLYIDGYQFSVLERPWLNNRSNISCIPSGIYRAKFLPRSGSGKYRKVWHLQDTGSRLGILMHNGNLLAHTKGCLLLGTRQGTLGGRPAVLGSRTALRKLRTITKCADFTLHIINKERD